MPAWSSVKSCVACGASCRLSAFCLVPLPFGNACPDLFFLPQPSTVPSFRTTRSILLNSGHLRKPLVSQIFYFLPLWSHCALCSVLLADFWVASSVSKSSIIFLEAVSLKASGYLSLPLYSLWYLWHSSAVVWVCMSRVQAGAPGAEFVTFTFLTLVLSAYRLAHRRYPKKRFLSGKYVYWGFGLEPEWINSINY